MKKKWKLQWFKVEEFRICTFREASPRSLVIIEFEIIILEYGMLQSHRAMTGPVLKDLKLSYFW